MEIIEGSTETEVYVSVMGKVCIRQDDIHLGESIIILSTNQVEDVIRAVQNAQQKALDFVPENEEESA